MKLPLLKTIIAKSKSVNEPAHAINNQKNKYSLNDLGIKLSTAIISLALLAVLSTLSLSVSASCSAPSQPSNITGNTGVCYRSSQTYSVSPVLGATSYKWTLPVGWSGSSTTNSITLTAGIAGGTLSVVASDSCGNSPVRSLTISVTVIPNRPGLISGATSVCPGSSQTYGIVAIAGATSYSWTLPSGWSGTSDSSSISTTADSAGGSISITANNTCGSSAAYILNVALRAVPNQPGSIAGNTTVCSGSAPAYTIAAVNGAINYTWSLPDGWSGYSGSTKINTIAGSAGGVLSVTANNSCGSSVATTITINVNALAAEPAAIIGNTTACAASTNIYSVFPVSGATGYTWHLPSGWTGSSATNSISTTASSNSGTMTVTANNSCGNSAARSLSVVINKSPAQPGIIKGAASACTGSSQTYSVTAVAGASSYTWSLPSDWTGDSDSSSIAATAGTSGGTISVQANNGCGSGTSQNLNVIITTAAPSPISSITGNTSVCSGTSQTYSVTAVAGATSYSWTLPSGWSGTSTINSITAHAGSSSGNISVTTNNNCGSDSGRTLSIAVSGIPSAPGTIIVSGGSANVCPGDTRTYIVPLIEELTYNWTVPAGLTIISGQGTDSLVVTFTNSFTTSAVLSVKATNSCGTSQARTISISRNIPATPSAIVVSEGTVNVCPGDSRTFSVTAVAGLTYNWVAPTGATIISGQGSHSIVVHFTNAFTNAATLKVTASNACSTGNASNISILRNTPVSPGNIYVGEGANTVCAGDTRTYRVISLPGMTYNWTAPTGGTILAGQGTYSVTLSFDSNFVAADYVQVSATNTCSTGPSGSLFIQRNAPAIPGPVTGAVSVCAGSTKVYSISAVANAASYIWSVPVGATINSGQGTNRISVLWTSGNGNLSVASINGCGTSTSRAIDVNMSCRDWENQYIDSSMATSVVVFPNPTLQGAEVQFNSISSGNYTIHVTDITGREIQSINGITAQGINTVGIDLSDYLKGFYFIHLQSGNTNETIKIMRE